jgi:hypothetical protein
MPRIDAPSAAKTAIARLRKKVRPGHEDQVVEDVLCDARFGPYDRDGNRRT